MSMIWRIDQIALERPENLYCTVNIQERENKPLDKAK